MKLLRISLLVLLVALAACRQPTVTQTDDPYQIALTAEPSPPQVGEATLFITLADEAGEPINGAVIDVIGDMTHAGMQPVIRQARGASDSNGTYEVPFIWTMRGDWFIDVTVNLPDGTQAKRRFTFTLTR